MPSKHKPIGVRFPPEQLAQIDAWAKANKMTRHGAALKLIELSFRRASTPSPEKPKGVTPQAPKPKTQKPPVLHPKPEQSSRPDLSSVPLYDRKRWHPMPKTGKKGS